MAETPQSRRPTLWRRATAAVMATAKDYVIIVRGRAEGAGLAALSDLARQSLFTWPGLVALAAAVVATAVLSTMAPNLPSLRAELWEGEWVQGPVLALILALLVWALAWAYLLAGAARAGSGWYVLTACYAAYFAGYVVFELRSSAWFALLPLWLLALGAWAISAHKGRWRALWLLPLSGVTALYIRSALGLSHVLPDEWGAAVLTLILWAIVANPLVLRPRRFLPGWALGITAAVLILYNGLALLVGDRAILFGDAFLSFHQLFGLVGLIWYWVGVDLFSGAQDLAEWATSAARRLLPRRTLAISILVIWLVWCVGIYLAVYGPPLPLVRALSLGRVGMGLLQSYLALPRLNTVADMTAQGHLYIMAGILALTVILWVAGKLTLERLMRLFSLSVMALVVLVGYYGLYVASASEEGAVNGFAPLLLFVAGMFWQILQLVADLLTGSETRRWMLLGFLMLLGGITLLELSAQYALYQLEIGLNTYLGVVYLAVPYVGYKALAAWRGQQLISVRRLLVLFALGMASAIPALALGRSVYLPPIWLAMGWLVLRRTPWRDAWDGVVCGLALGLGFSFYYADPFQMPIPAFLPVLGHFLQLQADYSARILWTWTPGFWWVLGTGLLAGGSLGALAGRARQAAGRKRGWLLAGGLALSLALCGVWELLPGPLP